MCRLLLIVLFLTVSYIAGQEKSTVSLEDYLEYFADENTVDEENSQIIESIELLLEYPLNINVSSVRELLIIPFLAFSDAQKIIQYRNQHGYYFSKKELYSIDDLDHDLIGLLVPLISVELPNPQEVATPPQPIDIELRSRQVSDMQNRRGFSTNTFKGNRIKSYNRLRIKYGETYSVGVLIEKDPGENDFADFSTYYLRINNIFNSEFILGDFISRFGQGLILWSPYSASKGSEAIAVINKSTKSFYPNSSSDENRFFHGAAVSTDLGGLSINGFYSQNRIDAKIDNDLGGITSLTENGYHRTESEADKKDKLINTTFGLGLHYSPFTDARISVLHLRTRLSKTLLPGDWYSLSGNEFNYSSLAYNLVFKRIYLSGEVATNSRSYALISNLALKITKGFSAIVSIRNYPYDYSALYSNGFGEGSSTQNEFGVYTGFRWTTEFGRFNFYYDQFKFPHVTYNNPLPSSGHEYLLSYGKRISSNTIIKLRFLSESKEITKDNSEVLQLFERNIRKYRLTYETNPSRNLRLKSQLEYITYRVEESSEFEKGYSAFQDVRFEMKDKLRLYGRIIMFRTDSYNSRLYQFENDLRGTLSNPALYGNGLRWYILITYKPFPGFGLSLKYSELYKPDESSLGSGYSEIPGNLDNRLSFQLDFSY